MTIQKEYKETSENLFSKITKQNYRKVIIHLSVKQRKFLLSYALREQCPFLFQIFYALVNDATSRELKDEYMTIYFNGLKRSPTLFSLQLLNYENMMRLFDESRITEIFLVLKSNIGTFQYSHTELLDILQVITIPEKELDFKNKKSKHYLNNVKQVQKKIYQKLQNYEEPEVVEALRDIIQELPHQYIPYYNQIKEKMMKEKQHKLHMKPKKNS